MYEEYADTYKFEEMIELAEEALIAYRKLQPDAIAFFTQTDWNKMTLKYCPYHIFQELLLDKTALIKRQDYYMPIGKTQFWVGQYQGHVRKLVAFFVDLGINAEC